MTTPTDIHSCSYFCTRPACVLAQRDEMRAELARLREQEPVAWIQHHKAGDNLVWDDPGGKKSPMYAAAPPAQPAAQPVQPQGWQPIETAPKDGQEFVTANSMQGFVKELVSWNRIHGYWQSKGKSIHMQATHWMPLPARPGGAS